VKWHTRQLLVLFLLILFIAALVEGYRFRDEYDSNSSSYRPEVNFSKIVQASEILNKIKSGQPIEYNHVIIKGNVDLKDLNLSNWSPYSTYSAFSRTFSRKYNKPYVLESPIYIEDSIIDGDVNLRNAIFMREVDFKGTRFNGTTDFGRSNFRETADFTYSYFNEDASFYSTVFNDDAGFREAVFKRDAMFSYSVFGGDAYFWASIFVGDTYFKSTVFLGKADFPSSRFLKNAYFNQDYFSSNKSSVFGDAKFFGSHFLGNAYFNNMQFIGEVDFRNSYFNQTADFKESGFHNVANFVGSEFTGSLNLTRMIFSQINIDWPNVNNLICEDGPTFLALIKNCRDLEQYSDADKIYYQYRSWRKDQKPWSDESKYFDLLALYTCGYGVRVDYTIRSGLFVLIFFTIIYSLKLKRSCKKNLFQKIKESFWFSLIVLLSVPKEFYLYGDETYNNYIKNIKTIPILVACPLCCKISAKSHVKSRRDVNEITASYFFTRFNN